VNQVLRAHAGVEDHTIAYSSPAERPSIVCTFATTRRGIPLIASHNHRFATGPWWAFTNGADHETTTKLLSTRIPGPARARPRHAGRFRGTIFAIRGNLGARRRAFEANPHGAMAAAWLKEAGSLGSCTHRSEVSGARCGGLKGAAKAQLLSGRPRGHGSAFLEHSCDLRLLAKRERARMGTLIDLAGRESRSRDDDSH